MSVLQVPISINQFDLKNFATLMLAQGYMAIIPTSKAENGIMSYNLALNCTGVFKNDPDHELINAEDLEKIYKYYMLDNKYGPFVWVVHKRKQEPELLKNHIKDSIWNLTNFERKEDERQEVQLNTGNQEGSKTRIRKNNIKAKRK